MNACKSLARIAALALVVLALGACATQEARYAEARAERAQLIDYEKVAMINHVARRKGVEVHWVNPPFRTDSD